MKWNSFRVRLTLWNVGVLVLLLLGLGVALGATIQNNVAAGIDQGLAEQLDGLRGDRFVQIRKFGPAPFPPGGPGFGGGSDDHGPHDGGFHEHGRGSHDDSPGPNLGGSAPDHRGASSPQAIHLDAPAGGEGHVRVSIRHDTGRTEAGTRAAAPVPSITGDLGPGRPAPPWRAPEGSVTVRRHGPGSVGLFFRQRFGPGDHPPRPPDFGWHSPPPLPESFRRSNPEAALLFELTRTHFIGTDRHGLNPQEEEKPLDEKLFRASLAGQRGFATLTQSGHTVRVYSRPLTYQGKVVAVVQTGAEASELDRLRDEMLRTLLAFLPLAMLLAGLGGLFLTNRALRPVRDVTHAAAVISAEDMSRRLTVTGEDELAELAATFNGMLARLDEAFRRRESAYEQLRRFTADVSHELRTPLTRLKGSTSLALSAPRTEEQYRKALRTADQAADTMTRLVQDLLLLARSDAGQLQPVLQPTELRDVLYAVAEPYLEITEGPRVCLDLPGCDLILRADPAHLERLFQNLLENAIRHTPPEGTITLSARTVGAQVQVCVRDTGEGIPPEHLPHVLERFYRVDAARHRSRGGTGLGLSIVQSIVQSHHGTLEIASQPGLGTTVTLTFPLEPAPSLQEPPLPLPEPAVPA